MAANNNDISPFHAAIHKLSKELVDEEVKELKYLCKKFVPKSKENVTALVLFEILEECGKISEGNYQFVLDLLDHIKREDRKKQFLQDVQPGRRISSDQPPVNPTVDLPISPQEGLKTPSHYAHTSPPPISQGRLGIFDGIPKPARSLSEAPASSVDQSIIKGVYNVDGTPRSTSGDDRSLKTAKMFSSSPSLQYDQSSGNTSGFSSGQLRASGSQFQGRNVEGLMKDLSLQDSTQLEDKMRRSDLLDNDVETDSPSLVREGHREYSTSHHSQVRGATAPLTKSPESDSVSRSHPCETSSPHQDQVPMPWPLSSDSTLLDLSTDSLVDNHQPVRQERHLLDVAPDEMVHHLDRMMDQQEVREEARASDIERPNLREYQKELAERPLRNFDNHIICAPTGSGKTLTAAYICYEYWTWFNSSVSHKNFKALFIVNMRHLTLQQRDAFQQYFPTRQAVRTIRDQETFTDALKIDKPMPAVLMLTAQIFVNALKSNAVNIKDLDMIIFDECHHTDLKHPYNEIMKMYLKKKQTLPKPQRVGVSGAGLPFIIGLSASLGVGSGALSHLLTLCANMDAISVIRVLRNTDELRRYVNTPTEDCMKIVSRRANGDRQFGDLLEAVMIQIEDQLPDIEEHPLPSRGSQLYESEAMERRTKAQELSDRTAIIVYMYLYEYNRALMLYDDLRVTDGLKHLEKFHDSRQRSANVEQIPTEEHCRRLFESNLGNMKQMSREESEHSNEKLAELAFLLQQIFAEKHNSKGIILVRMKVATTAISDFIRKSTLLQALPCRVCPQRFVGQGDIEDHCLTEAEQKTALKLFRDEDGCNVLVATDIAQEGLDMPACNFVIRYNFVSNEIGTVQSKGRARAEGSQCFLIVESGSLNEKRELENRHKVEKMEEAMVELEAMTESERHDKITERQNEILEKIRKAEEEAGRQQAMYNLDKITIQCKECAAFVCKASELRRKGDGGHVTCINPDFKKWVKEFKYRKPQRFRDTETVGLISCGTYDCGMQFGTSQKFLMLHPPDGYALKATSFKIHFERGGVKTPKQWKKAGFEIIKDEN